MHEEIPEVEETLKVERTAKRLVTEVQVCFGLTTSSYYLVKLSDLAFLHAGLNEDRKVLKEVLRPD